MCVSQNLYIDNFASVHFKIGSVYLFLLHPVFYTHIFHHSSQFMRFFSWFFFAHSFSILTVSFISLPPHSFYILNLNCRNVIIHHKTITFEIIPLFLLSVINNVYTFTYVGYTLMPWHSVCLWILVYMSENLLVLCQHFELMCVRLIIIPVKLTQTHTHTHHALNSSHSQRSMVLKFSRFDLFVAIQSLRLESFSLFLSLSSVCSLPLFHSFLCPSLPCSVRQCAFGHFGKHCKT